MKMMRLSAAGWLIFGASGIVPTILTGVFAKTCDAANLKLTPSLTVEEMWDSNVFNAADNEVSDFVFRASPRLALTLETPTAAVTLSGGPDYERYADHPELDKDSATKFFELSSASPLRITPRFSFRPSARYVETWDAARRNALTQDAATGLPVTEVIVTARTNVRDYGGSLSMFYSLTPNVELTMGGGMLRREYTEGPPTLVNSRTVSGNGSVDYRISERWTTGLYAAVIHNSFDGKPDSRTYSGGLSVTHRITEYLTFGAHAGAGYSRESSEIGDNTTHTWSPDGSLSLVYSKENFRVSLQGSYGIGSAGSTGRSTKRGNVGFLISDRFAEYWEWNLSGYWQTNKSTDNPRTEDVDTAGGVVGIRYLAARCASLGLSGSTVHQRSRGLLGSDLERYSVMIGLTLTDTFKIL